MLIILEIKNTAATAVQFHIGPNEKRYKKKLHIHFLLKLRYLEGGSQNDFQQYFIYIVAVSFNGGGSRSTQRKPSTYRKSLTNFIT